MELPWSTNQLKKLGRCIRDGTAPIDLPPYEEVMLYYNDLAAETQQRIKGLDWESLLGDRRFEVTSRPKTIDTLRQKLQRERATPLPSIQDIAGVRFEAEMTLDEQDAVAVAVAGLFGHDVEACKRDLRKEPHSGYRAVHLWLRMPSRVEVQIRTHLQGEWANMYESAADVLGRDIRYGWLPEDPAIREMIEQLHELSVNAITALEIMRNELFKIGTTIETLRAVGGKDAGLQETLKIYDETKAKVLSLEVSVREKISSHKKAFDTIRSKREG